MGRHFICLISKDLTFDKRFDTLSRSFLINYLETEINTEITMKELTFIIANIIVLQ